MSWPILLRACVRNYNYAVSREEEGVCGELLVVWGRGREWRPAAPVCCLPPHDRARSKSRVTDRKQLRSQEGFILGRWNRKEIERSRSRRASLARPLSQHKQAQRRSKPPPQPACGAVGNGGLATRARRCLGLRTVPSARPSQIR